MPQKGRPRPGIDRDPVSRAPRRKGTTLSAGTGLVLLLAGLVALAAAGCAGTAGRIPRPLTVVDFLTSLDGEPCVQRYLSEFLTPRVDATEDFNSAQTGRLTDGDFGRSRVAPDFESVRRADIATYTTSYPTPEAHFPRLPAPAEFGVTTTDKYNSMPFLPEVVDATTELDTLVLAAPDGNWSLLVPYKKGPPDPTLLLSPFWILLRNEATGDRYRLDLLFSHFFFPDLAASGSRTTLDIFAWRDGETLTMPYLRWGPRSLVHMDLLEFDLADGRVTYYTGPSLQTPLDDREIELSRMALCLIPG